MLTIDELIYNGCEWNGTVTDYEVSLRRIQEGILHCNQLFHGTVTRIYIGFEYCETMMRMCSVEALLKKIQVLREDGYRVSFVLPLMHECNTEKFREWIAGVSQSGLVDEWIVNEIGVLALLREEVGADVPVILGRLFDKTIREPRLNLMKEEMVAEHLELLRPKDWLNQYNVGILPGKDGIIGAETDTLPDGMLDFTGMETPYRVHYPDIYVSSSAVCEWSGLKDAGEMEVEHSGVFCLGGSCRMQCRYYSQEISNAHGIPMQKKGTAITCKQTKPLRECAAGTVKLVFSDR